MIVVVFATITTTDIKLAITGALINQVNQRNKEATVNQYSKNHKNCRIKMIFFSTKAKRNPFKKANIVVVASICVFLVVPPLYAEQRPLYENTENIRLAATNFLQEITNAADNPSIEIKVNELDSRLRLRRCESQLNADLPPSSKAQGRVTVSINCTHPVSWRVFVSATVYEYAEVVIAKNVLTKKTLISEQDIEIKKVNISTLRKQPIFNKTLVINTRTKRYLRAGTVISADSICMVCRGDVVEVVAKNSFFNINLKGVALADATMGSNTKIRNSQSNRSFTARVIGRNQLEVPLIATQ